MSGRRKIRVIGQLLACVAVAATPAATATRPLLCPAGTDFQVKTLKGGKIEESCLDGKNARLEGPMRVFTPKHVLRLDGHYRQGKMTGVVRLYLPDGEVSREANYEDGKLVSSHETLAGLRKIAADENARNLAAGIRRTMSYPDEHHMQIEIVLVRTSARNSLEASEMREALRTDSKFCALLLGRARDIASVRLRYLQPNRDLLVETEVTRADCLRGKAGVISHDVQ